MKKPRLNKADKPAKEPKVAPAGGNSTDPKRRELFLSDLERWQKLEAAVKKATTNRREHEKQIKDDGFSMGQIKLAALVQTPEGEIEYRHRVSCELLAAQWVGAAIGSQLQLFLDDKDRTPAVDRAYDEGELCSMENRAAVPPYDPSTPQYKAFLDGFHFHQEKILKAGIKPMSDGAPPRSSDMH